MRWRFRSCAAAADIGAVKKIIAAAGRDTPVIAKLEKPQAIENLEEILQIADGVMVARGDLGVEVPPEKVPIIQKRIIRRALHWRKPVITATQMLDSMIQNPRPTRAEASDVANAIYDGTDAVMLSGETASGLHPCEAVSMMARIVVEAEADIRKVASPRRREIRQLTIPEAICESVAHVAEELNMRGIAVFTTIGQHRGLDFQVPAPRRGLCLLARAGGLQPAESLLGSAARARPKCCTAWKPWCRPPKPNCGAPRWPAWMTLWPSSPELAW